MNTEKIQWEAGATAPESYPMVILSPNVFYSENGKDINIIPNMTNMQGGWRGAGNTLTNDPKPIPDYLDIAWYSPTEMKIYKGTFKLPQQTIYKLFKEGYMTFGPNPEKTEKNNDYTPELHNETYDCITVGLAPQGMVVVWVVGQNKVEIERFQAQELDRKKANEVYKIHFGRDEEMPYKPDESELKSRRVKPEVIDLALQGKVTCKQWDDYLLRYNWKVEINKPVTIYQFDVEYFNSEHDGYPPPSMTQETFNKKIIEPISKAVPNYIGIYGTAQNGQDYLIRVETFDEQETIEAFKSLESASPKQVITMFIDVNDDFNAFKVVLKNDKKEILLQKDSLKLFTMNRKDETKNKKIFESLKKK